MQIIRGQRHQMSREQRLYLMGQRPYLTRGQKLQIIRGQRPQLSRELNPQLLGGPQGSPQDLGPGNRSRQ